MRATIRQIAPAVLLLCFTASTATRTSQPPQPTAGTAIHAIGSLPLHAAVLQPIHPRLIGSCRARSVNRNPQEVALYLQKILASTRYTNAQKRCLTTTAVDALLRTAAARDGASLFPYAFDYSMGRAGTLRAPWFSGLAQTTLMGSLRGVAELTGSSTYERAAREAFESLFLSRDKGGFVEEVAGGVWIQEYPSATPSYVLNGHLFSILSARSFGDYAHDSRGADLLARGAKAAEALLPLYNVPMPGGAVSAYDLLRREAGAPIRATGQLEIRNASIVDSAGKVLATLNSASLGSSKGLRPSYPISVRAVPRVFVRIAYSGSGSLEGLANGSWTHVATLGAGGDTLTAEVPQRLQGRTINLRYHAIHVEVLRRLARATGNQTFANWASHWASG